MDDFDFDELEPKQPTKLDKDKEALRQAEEEQLARSYKRILETPHGKQVYKDLLAKCQVFHNSFRSESQKLQDFIEGRRSIGLYVMHRCEFENVSDFKKLEE